MVYLYLQTDYGDVFDCVNIYKQPAFAHTLLKNHKLKVYCVSFPAFSLV